MPSMTDCRREDVVLVRFVFTDESGVNFAVGRGQLNGYHRSRREVIVAAITSNVKRRLFVERRTHDGRIRDCSSLGGHVPDRSVARAKIDRRLVSMAVPDLDAVNHNLRRCLDV